MALERRPKAIMLSFGNPGPFVEQAKRAGSLVICQVQSVTMALEAVAAGPIFWWPRARRGMAT